MTNLREEIASILSGYASYTHVPKGLETSAEIDLDTATEQIQALIQKSNKELLERIERSIPNTIGSNMSDIELVDALKKMYQWGIQTGYKLESGRIKRVDEREWDMIASRLDQFEQTFTNRANKTIRDKIKAERQALDKLEKEL